MGSRARQASRSQGRRRPRRSGPDSARRIARPRARETSGAPPRGVRLERRVDRGDRRRGDAEPLAQAHRVAVEGLELEPLASGEVLVERREIAWRDGGRCLHGLVHDAGREPGLRRGGQRDDLLDDRPEHPPALRRVANDADRAARECGHACHRADQHVLLPECAPDVRRELGVDRGAGEAPGQRLRARRQPPVELAEDDPAGEVVGDDAGPVDGREHPGDAAHGGTGAQDLVDRVVVVEAVLEGEDGRVGSDDGADALGGRLGVERLHAEEDDLGRGEATNILDGREADDGLALDGRADAQAVALDRPQMLAPRDQRDRLAGTRELRAEVTADAARAHDDDVHGMMIHCAKNMSASLERRVAIDAARAAGRLLQSELQGSRHIAYKGSPTNLATVNDQPLGVSPTATLGESLVATGFPYNVRETADNNLREYAAFTVRTRGVRRMGSAVLYLAWLAAGRLDGYWELRLGPWDAAAGSLLVEEAGGRVTNLTGGALDLDAPALVASNGKIHAAMLAVLEEIRG